VDTRQVRAYCVAEAFNFPTLRKILGDNGYYPFTALSEDCIHVNSEIDGQSSEVGDIFFFMDGTVVSWGLSEEDILRLLDQIKPAEIEPYTDIEEEELDYVQDPQLRTGMMGETLIIGREQDNESSIYAKLAFSNGIARSTKLAVLEEQLDNYLDSTREIPKILARGKKLPWGRQKTLQKVGELLAFRGELNLHSELVETPDLYWAKPQLEEYYNRISKNLDVAVRITILNKKLDYANELAATLRSHLSEKHGLALEWGIIGLIAIEVVFGIIELVK
jgi:required for meiotic nuclear division protein 1